jgi:hypothetical protein
MLGALRLAVAALVACVLPVAGFSAGVGSSSGAQLRALDKISGISSDVAVRRGDTVRFNRLSITLHDCRYPSEDPTSNAFASLTIVDDVQNAVVFDGWMIADSPALSALDHHRYDVWVVRCDT